MFLSLIAALADNYVIGKQNQLPWHLPADLKHFKELTWGKPILMGRKTYESIGKPLPGRRNIIITRDNEFRAEGCEILHTLEDALALTQEVPELMIIGGAELFAQTLPKADRLYLTLIHYPFDGDSFFPHWNPKEWQETARVDLAANAQTPYAYSFVLLQRIRRDSLALQFL